MLREVGDDTPYYVLTSHLPEGGAAQRMADAAMAAKALSGVLQLNDPVASQALKERFGWPTGPRMGPAEPGSHHSPSTAAPNPHLM